MSRKTIHVLLIVSIFLSAGLAVFGQVSNREVDAIFADLTKPGSPGCALGVYRDSKIIYAKGYGLANIEGNVPITSNTVFDVGSISKQFTAASILLLEKRGQLRLDDDVRKYVPELPDYSQGRQKITILHLLNHTSGIRDYVSLFLLAGIHFDNVTTNDDALGIIVRQKGLNFLPGTDWKYTGSGYLLLSIIVNRVSGKTLKDFAAENIFQPLGMTHTQFRDDHTSLIPNRALAYELGEDSAYKLSVSYAEENGDGMVHTSIEDLQKWDENFYSGQIGGMDLIEEMQEPGKLENGEPLKYAKGLFLRNYRGLSTLWHGGESGGYLSYLIRFPDQHFSIACLCNGAASPFQRSHRVASLYLKNLMKTGDIDFATAGIETKTATSISIEQLRLWSGDYRNSKNGDIWTVSEKDGTLWLAFEGVRRPLRALSTTEFEALQYVHQIRLEFDAAQDGRRRRLVVLREMQPYAILEAVERFAPSVAKLSACAGNYWSDELRATYRLVMHNRKLWMTDLMGSDGIVHRGIIPSGELRPVLSDEFELSAAPLIFRFSRNDKGNVTGFFLNGLTERGIGFTRVEKPR